MYIFKFNRRKHLELKEEYEDLQTRVKIRSMGNTKFVGELYKMNLLSINIMNSCIRQLVQSNNETELESLCKLIPTIGRRMEGEQKGQEVKNLILRNFLKFFLNFFFF